MGVPIVLNLNCKVLGAEVEGPDGLKAVFCENEELKNDVSPISNALLNWVCFKSQSFVVTLSLPPNSFILKIVLGIPYDVIKALNPAIVPFVFNK